MAPCSTKCASQSGSRLRDIQSVDVRQITTAKELAQLEGWASAILQTARRLRVAGGTC